MRHSVAVRPLEGPLFFPRETTPSPLLLYFESIALNHEAGFAFAGNVVGGQLVALPGRDSLASSPHVGLVQLLLLHGRQRWLHLGS